MKRLMTVLLVMGVASCGPEHKYSGDGVLTAGRGIHGNSIYQIQLPPIDLSKPHTEKYNLTGIPPSELNYKVTLVVPATNEIPQAAREAWGICSFKIKKGEATVFTLRSEFSAMRNCIYGSVPNCFNGLYTQNNGFMVPKNKEPWELIFECPGFPSSAPVWAHIELLSGGE